MPNNLRAKTVKQLIDILKTVPDDLIIEVYGEMDAEIVLKKNGEEVYHIDVSECEYHCIKCFSKHTKE